MTSLLAFAPNFLAQTETSTSTEGHRPGPLFWICYLVVLIFLIAAIWKVFSKAGQPGWAVLIPIYNVYVLCKIAGRPGWWVLLMLIPFVNFVIAIILCLDVSKAFGKGAGFAVGLILLPFVFYPILGFGSAQYHGPSPTTTS